MLKCDAYAIANVGKGDYGILEWYKIYRTQVLGISEHMSLNAYLLDNYDVELFNAKIVSLMNHFVDIAVRKYGWVVT